MTTFIAGGTGFIGRRLVPLLAQRGEEIVCIGSVDELIERAGLSKEGAPTDLHREFVDKITIPSEKGKGNLKRVEEVFDCWFESGSMPYASFGFPKHFACASSRDGPW